MKAKRVNNVAKFRTVEAKVRQITVRDSRLLARATAKPTINRRTSQGLSFLSLSQAMLCHLYSGSSLT
jgi:hypothetical protein